MLIGVNREFSDEQNDEGDGRVCGLGHVGCGVCVSGAADFSGIYINHAGSPRERKNMIMKKSFLGAVMVTLVTYAAVADRGRQESITVRAADNAIRWQTCLPSNAGAPLMWRWDDDADSAYLTITCHVERMVAGPFEINRTSGAKYGSYGINGLVGDVDSAHLYDLVLEMRNGEEVTSSKSARLAVLPTAIALRKASPSRLWRLVDKSDVYIVSYDRSWSNATLTAESASLAMIPEVGSESSVELDGIAGFVPLYVGSFMSGSVHQASLELKFDNVSVWDASLAARVAMSFVIR